MRPKEVKIKIKLKPRDEIDMILSLSATSMNQQTLPHRKLSARWMKGSVLLRMARSSWLPKVLRIKRNLAPEFS